MVSALVIAAHFLVGGGTKKRPPRQGQHVVRIAPVKPPSARRARLESAERRAIERVLAYTPYISQGSRHKREVALTFDDGPGPATPQIIRILRKSHAPATFFQVGQMVRSNPNLARKEVADGFAVGLHTNHHARLKGMPLAAQLSETDPANEELQGYAPSFMHLLRPPYGAFDKRTLAVMKARHTLVVLWSISTFDYQLPGSKAIVRRAVRGAFPGAIILMHDAGGLTRAQTVKALPQIVKGLRHRGFRLVTVPRMILDDPPPRRQRARAPGAI